MLSPKKKYEITVKCLQCDYQRVKQTDIEPENLMPAEMQLAKEVASAHKKHPDLNNFNVTHKEI